MGDAPNSSPTSPNLSLKKKRKEKWLINKQTMQWMPQIYIQFIRIWLL